MNGVMLACSRRAICRKRVIPTLSLQSNSRWYSATRPAFDEETSTATAVESKEDKKALRQIALEYGRRKASYKRQVSKLRKEYMEEHKRHKAEDDAARDAEQAETTRKRLERQRGKNERSVQNAIRQKELRRQARLAFQDRLVVEQEKREAKAVLRNKARQLCIDELEEEAPMWLTTAEEVDAAFTHEGEQLLWGRPHGFLGTPNPTLDSHYWQFETHTWDMSKTYKTQKELLLEQLEDEVYDRTNIDPDFWTPERIAKHEALESKARLRANVRSAGRKELLRRQKEFLDEETESKPGEPPKSPPVPSLGVLANLKAQEKEGSELLFKDPTQFFIFGRDHEADDGEIEDTDIESYSGPSLGAPVDLKDPLRSGGPNGDVFPVGIGKVPKPDTRSEKEKKKEEREQKLWAAAQAQAMGADEVDLAAEEEISYGEPIDYDNNTDWDSDDEEWEKGLDPEADADLLAVPRRYRYREDDIDWVIDTLKKKAEDLQSHVRTTVNSLEQDKRAKMQTSGANVEEEDGSSAKFFDEESSAKLADAGGDVEKFEALMASLSQEQLLSVYALESKKQNINVEAGESVFDTIPGLTAEQVTGLTELDMLLHKIEEAESEDVF